MRHAIWLAALTTTLLAAPTQTKRDSTEWTPTLAGYFDVVYSYIEEAKAAGASPPSCDLSKAAMPVASTPLPTPDGLSLVHVAVGRGVQNYTCANATATPAAVGAVAKFYNASCVAADYPDLLGLIPTVALSYRVPSAADAPLEPSDLSLSSHHFFSNTSTPVFAFDVSTGPQLGRVSAEKVKDSAAPSNAPAGVNGQGNGAVPWLYLTSRPDTVGNIKAVYRLSTAGGSPPASCANQASAFSVDYSAIYWFWE
ncbi:hypothetical protein A1O3_03145 [Capronia epimyces CBS 606.96]|uniref:Malate dehydrogenase n=1 Tax=Capronia epimyces CBS 606.96 TaxID=1182542 RepID=W9YLE9_9EURO|nr:uncharacterized protein A1O3_03145 [Capronia epimyces CBS 606.96]EXJ90076.1 hypothetical protein A1O3_03145 [Capronia epimyces CBS 606.96]